MRIKTLLLTGTLISLIALAVAMLVLVEIRDQHRRDTELQHVTDQIGMRVFQLSSLTTDYLLHPTPRAAGQWRNTHRLVAETLGRFQQRPGNGLLPMLEELRSHHDKIGDFFERLARLDRKSGDAPSDVAVRDYQRTRLGEQLQSRALAMSELITRLSTHLNDHHIETSERGAKVINAVIALLGLMLLAAWGVWGLRVVAPIRRLTLALSAVGPERLDLRLPVEREDEIGAVAHAFNQLAAKLENTTVSRNRLAEEVEGRRRAEQVLKQHRDTLQQLVALGQEASTLQEREILAKALDIGVARTASKIGYLHGVNDDQESVELIAWNAAALELCTASFDGHYPLSRAGVWADCARFKRPALHNDYPGLKEKPGYPEGHFPVLRHLSVPVLEGGQVRMILGVGNKEEPYDEHDVAHLQTIANEVQKMVTRRRMELALFQAHREAQAANRAKSEFLATMSHEIRTPMNVVIGLGDVLLETPLDDDQRHYVELLQNSGKTLLGLINNILDLSRIEAGRLELSEAAMAPRQLLEEIGEVMGEVARRKGLKFTIETDERLPEWVMGDEGRIRQVLINVIGNAIKFTEQGRIAARLDLDPSPPGESLHWSITDTGIGIAVDHLETIFEAFSQADSSITRRFGGSGLGLAISKRLVEHLGGRMWVESEIGHGSTFHFSTPLRRAEAPAAEVPPRSEAADHGARRDAAEGLRILLAEDSEDNRMLISTYLKNTTHLLTMVCDGKEAVARVQRESFDLVLMDMQMPVMDGYTATRTIREWEREGGHRPLPILALTAHALEGDEQKSLDAGCTAHLTKPIKKARLLKAITNFTDHPPG